MRDGDIITRDDACEAGWYTESLNAFTKAVTFSSPNGEYGVTFYEGHATGTVYRQD